MICYAQWNPIVYSVNFNANGGTGTMPSISLQYDMSSSLPVNKYTKNGYTFAGWNTKPDGSGKNYSNQQQIRNLTTTANENIILYAKWVANSGYSISYDLDGGNTITSNPVSYDVTTPTFTLNNPTKEGYDFTGWTGSNGSTPKVDVTISKGTTGNLNYKANYKIRKYKIEFKWDDETKELELEYNTKISNIPTPNKKGKVFVGWFDESGKGLVDKVPAENKVYNAEFRPVKYKILYNSNGGNGEMSNQELEYGEKEGLSQNTFTREKYNFKEWNTKADGSGTKYSNNEEIINLTEEDDKGIVLYAIWELADLPDDDGSHGLDDPKDEQDKPSDDEKTDSESKTGKGIKNPETGGQLGIISITLLGILGVFLYKKSSKELSKRKI